MIFMSATMCAGATYRDCFGTMCRPASQKISATLLKFSEELKTAEA